MSNAGLVHSSSLPSTIHNFLIDIIRYRLRNRTPASSRITPRIVHPRGPCFDLSHGSWSGLQCCWLMIQGRFCAINETAREGRMQPFISLGRLTPSAYARYCYRTNNDDNADLLHDRQYLGCSRRTGLTEPHH